MENNENKDKLPLPIAVVIGFGLVVTALLAAVLFISLAEKNEIFPLHH